MDGRDLADYGRRGVATPEQVIRIKSRPAILPVARAGHLAEWEAAAEAAIAGFIAEYEDYFHRHNARVGGNKKPLDPLPRVLAIPGFGIVGIGKSAQEASVSADVAEAWIEAVLDAEAVGRFESITEADHFDMEYWSLEQAKLGKARRRSGWRARSSPSRAAAAPSAVPSPAPSPPKVRRSRSWTATARRPRRRAQ